MVSNNQELEKAKTHIIAEAIEYIPKSVVINTIIQKNTGNISAVSLESGEILSGKISSFDTFIQIIDGEAVVMIDHKAHKLGVGESIIIPAHTHNIIEAKVRFKMISTVIKSGYEEGNLNSHPI